MSPAQRSGAKAPAQVAARKAAADKEFTALIEKTFREYAALAGLTNADGDVDPELLEDRVFEELETKVVRSINKPDDRVDPAKSSSKTELTEAIFAQGPTAKDGDHDPLMRAVWDRCSGAVWDLVRSGRRGRIQRRVESARLLVVHGKVYRNGNPVATGIYLTVNAELVKHEYLGPRLARLENLAAAIDEDFAYAREISPGLEGVMREEIEKALNKVIAKLPVHQQTIDGDARATLGDESETP
jgi:hypothetical protein